MLIKIISALVFLIVVYFLISIGTILKNGISLFEPPGSLERLKTLLSTNEVITSVNHQYPELSSRRYTISKQEFINTIKSTAQQLDYSLIKQSDDGLHFIVTSSIFKFKDDVYITIEETDQGLVVNARSKSRKGRADFGANIANIKRLFNTLEQSI